jgi:glycosyltransferase involved in cell wall biosynthesis
MKKELILVGLWQFGYRSDTDKFCEYLADEYNISYVCFDEYRLRVVRPETEVYYINPKNRLFSKVRLIVQILQLGRLKKHSVVYMTYFRFSSLISILLPTHKVIIDYRTGSVSTNKFKNWFKNSNMLIESKFFKKIVTITEDVRIHLKLPKKTIIFPLGSDIISHTNKSFDELKLLYVGALANSRQVEKTIFGVATFKKNHPEIPIFYYIIGKGENSLIEREIEKYHAEDYIKFLGFVPNEDIVKYYDVCNVGICYAPVTKAHSPQPFTKLYEYTLSGMSVISTKVLDSVRRINENVGVLCEDNEQGFADSLEEIFQHRKNYNSDYIRNHFKKYTWKEISKQFRSIIDD